MKEFHLDNDTCDFFTTCRMLSVIPFPVEIRRSSSRSGYHLKITDENSLYFDDLNRQRLRELGINLVLFQSKTGLKRMPKYSRVNLKKFARKILSRSAANTGGDWHKLKSLDDFLVNRI